MLFRTITFPISYTSNLQLLFSMTFIQIIHLFQGLSGEALDDPAIVHLKQQF